MTIADNGSHPGDQVRVCTPEAALPVMAEQFQLRWFRSHAGPNGFAVPMAWPSRQPPDLLPRSTVRPGELAAMPPRARLDGRRQRRLGDHPRAVAHRGGGLVYTG
jgi:hypothetical protein